MEHPAAEQEQLEALRQAERDVARVRDAMASLAASAKAVRTPNADTGAAERALGDAHDVVIVACTYWANVDRANVDGANVDRSAELEARLTAVEGEIQTLRGQADIDSERIDTVVAAVIRIGAATLLGACIGAPLGAFLVGDDVVKEMVKGAVTGFVVQAGMEITEAGIDHAGARRNPADDAVAEQ